MIKLKKHPLERRGYFISADDNKTENDEQWNELKAWLDTNAPGWSFHHGIITLPKMLPAIETYFTLRYQ